MDQGHLQRNGRRGSGAGLVQIYRARVFPLLAAALWVGFLTLDVTGWGDSTALKFLSICLCGVTAWTGVTTRDGLWVALALSLTVCADVFLLALNRGVADRITGVAVFLCVQALYALRLWFLRERRVCRWGAALRLLSLAALPALDSRLYALSAVYFVNLCVNCLEALTLGRGRPAGRLGWGLLLFVCCDICVGCWNVGLLGDFARVGMWCFYLPSQALIVLSVPKKEIAL